MKQHSIRTKVAALAMAAMVVFGAASAPAAIISPIQAISIVSGGAYYQELVYNYDTAVITEVSPAINYDADVEFTVPSENWMGVFHFDYGTGAFTEGVYLFNDLL